MTEKIGLIADSCCDLPQQTADIQSVPLKIRVGDHTEYTDDGSVDIPALLADIAHAQRAVRSSCPSVSAYAECMRQHDMCFVVTLSAKLSGSYHAACVARQIVLEESPERQIHVFDSKSASAGEAELLLFLQEQIAQGLPFETIVHHANVHIAQTHTLFVLEDLSILRKNGRLSLVSGLIASVLSICPVMSDNGDGEIRMLAKVRGILPALSRLTSTVMDMTRSAARQSIRLVISNCNCPERAQTLRNDLLNDCPALKEIVMLSTGALSSTYANNGGIIIAFAQS